MASSFPTAVANMPSVLLPTHFSKPMPFPFLQKFNLKSMLKPAIPVQASLPNRVEVRAHLMKEKKAASLAAGVLSAAVVLPDMAQAVESSGGSSLKNFLLSIAAGGVVLAVILFAVIGVSNFDPVKRN